MPITILDLVLLGVMLISGLLAMVRGFMREILSIAAWGAAALVTLYAFSKLLPTAKTYFNNDTVASVVVVAGMGGSHGRRKQKHDHDGRRSHKTRKSQLDSHAFTYHGPAILTRCIRGVSESRVFPFPEAAFYKSSSRNRHGINLPRHRRQLRQRPAELPAAGCARCRP